MAGMLKEMAKKQQWCGYSEGSTLITFAVNPRGSLALLRKSTF